ncbi:MAG: type I-U CRISPR-associated helicase/endonuclease Cas3, partial [Acidobacteria bacterium]|nr:type I-U CRISPR-associated helicase/endonuclease Cas3 [Acidobacteriota bacterium]
MTEDRPHEAALPPMPAFAEFYRALNSERDPFPWQRRLAEQVAATEQWPAEVGVPTGLGKTACLDIAVWWLASQADRQPAKRTAPTRIWWVVNRRLLVDSTAEHAEWIAQVLADPDAANVVGRDREVVMSVAQRLTSLYAATDTSPLDVIRLRGGVASRTPTDPSQPTVLLCTLPMYGSRLLFRGYGSNQRLRVVDAAMAGTDSLVLLDEAHLAPHL